MARKSKALPGPSRLSKILENLVKAPRPYMSTLKSLKMTYAVRNDHFGARYFASEFLPRIRYANAAIAIEVNKVPKSVGDTWKPEMQLEFQDGTAKTLDLEHKMSHQIFEEVMDLAGGNNWQRWKRERTAAGLPLIDPKPPKAGSVEKNISSIADLFPHSGKTGAAAVLP